MPQRTDLYTILYSYAKKCESPSVDMDVFIPFLEKYAKRICGENPEWVKWTQETATRVWVELNHLAEEGKLAVQSDKTGNKVYLVRYYAEQVKDAYKKADHDSGMPFPDETSLKINIPQGELKPLDVSSDLPHFLEEPQKELVPIIKLIFPHGRGSALVLAPMIPFTLLEFSLIKIRDYLLRHGNKEYVQHKLLPQFSGKEDYLREILNQIMVHPRECINDLKGGREVSFYFWAFFCSLVKTDLDQKQELLAEETGALQAVCIVDACSAFFKNLSTRAKTVELALKNFEQEMDKPPYYFFREAIAQFKDNKGVPLLGQYSQEELDAYIKKRITEPTVPNELPDMLYFYTNDGTAWLVKKTRVLSLCARFLAEIRPLIIKVISRRWQKMLKEFRREGAMEDDTEFERLLASCVNEYAPMLKALLQDRQLYLIHEEMQSSVKELPESLRFFSHSELLPLRILLLLRRKQLISDIKLLIPFWYTLPFISTIVAFFMGLGRRKKTKQKAVEAPETKEKEPDPLKELQNAAEAEAAKMIPRNHTLNTYLAELASRWNKLINKEAKENLVEDVNSLIRDKLRYMLRLHKTIPMGALDKMATSILDNSEGLRKIGEKKSLFLYIKLYLIKLLTGKTVL